MTLIKRTNLIAVATLAVGLFACDRNADRAAQTNTTSAAVPAENAGTTTQAPVAPADTITSENANANANASTNANANANESEYAKDAGHVGTTSTTGSDLDLNAKDAGHASVSDNANAKDAGHVSLDKKKSTVAPGHIAVPSDHGRATGAPNSDGSHNLGPDGTQTR